MSIGSIKLRSDLLVISELINAGEKVLDLGCGDGTLLKYLVDTHDVTGRGVELSEAGVLACVSRGLSVRQGNLQEALGDYPDKAFDSVILGQTVPYIDDLSLVFKEMLRVGKRTIVSFPNWGHWRCRLTFLLQGISPISQDLPLAWESSPRIRTVTIRDFEEFCSKYRIVINKHIYLQHDLRIPDRFDKNLRATSAVYELLA